MSQPEKQYDSPSRCELENIVSILFEQENAGLLSAEDREAGRKEFFRRVDNSAFRVWALDEECVSIFSRAWSKKADVQHLMANFSLAAEISAVAQVLANWKSEYQWCAIQMQSPACMYFMVVDLKDRKILALYKHAGPSPFRFHEQFNR
ncbi:hypothetical protein LLG95_12360 [bacterium]|nr:hypothetical protein [bacterium]